MRLSDLMKKGSPNPGPQVRRAEPDPDPAGERPRAPVPPSADPPPEPVQRRAAPGTPPLSPVGAAVYDSIPRAIYEAALELNVPIPQNRGLAVQKARDELSAVFNGALDPAAGKTGLWEKVRGIADDLSVLLALDSNFARVIQRHTSPDERLLSHCINSAVIAMDLARNVEASEHTPHEIGAAALMHDIGIAALGLDMLREEDPKFVQHVEKGVEILSEMNVPEATKTMVAQHHERTDGSGYHAGLKGHDILISSQIIALAERFERIMCRSDDTPGAGDGDGNQNYVQETLTEFRKALYPGVLKAFIGLRGFYPDGTIVELTNRSVCLVVRQNEGFPLRPVLQVVVDGAGNHPNSPKIIDLRTTRTLSIIRAVTDDGGVR